MVYVWMGGYDKNIYEWTERDGSIQTARDFVAAWLLMVDLRQNQGRLFLQLNLAILKSDELKDSTIKFEKLKYLRMVIVQLFPSKCLISVQITAYPFYLSLQYYQNKEGSLLYIALDFIEPSVSLLLT